MTSYFIFLILDREDGEGYVIKTYEAADYDTAKEKYDEVTAGRSSDAETIASLLGPEFPHTRRIRVSLEKTEFDEDGDIPVSNEVLHTFELTR